MSKANGKKVKFPHRAIGYGRRSHFDPDSMSLQVQRAECEAWCKRNGVELAGWYEDHGISGRTDERPAYQALLTRLAEPGIDILLVAWLDRLCRSTRLYYGDIAPLRARHLRLVALDLPATDDPIMGDLVLGLMVQLGEFFSRQAGQRMRRLNAGLAAAGKRPGIALPMGYRWDKEAGEYRPDDRAPELVAVFREFCTQSGSMMSTCRALNARGVPAPRGGVWYIPTLRRLLLSPLHRGRVRYGGEEHEARVVPAVPPDLLAEAELLLAGSTTGSHSSARRALSGLLWCGHCHLRRLVSQSSDRGHGPHDFYAFACLGARVGACTSRGSISQAKLESAIGRALRERLLEWVGANPPPVQIQANGDSATLARLQARRRRILSAYYGGLSNEGDMRAALRPVDEALARVTQPPAPRLAMTPELVAEYVELLGTADWLARPESRRRAIYVRAISRAVVTFTPAEVVVDVGYSWGPGPERLVIPRHGPGARTRLPVI